MSSRIDTSGHFPGLREKGHVALSRIAGRALEGGVFGDIDDRDIAECREALEALAWPGDDTVERLVLWLGTQPTTSMRKAARLRKVLEACATVIATADPAQTGAIIGALDKFAYHLGGMVEGRAGDSQRELQGSDAGLVALERYMADANGAEVGVLIVHCGAIDQVDALRGLRAGDALVRAIGERLRGQVLRASDALELASRDEYACFLRPMPSEGVAILAAQKMLRVLDVPIELEEYSATPEPNIGIALSAQHGRDPAELMQRAKAALRTARAGRERIAVFRAEAPAAAFDESRYAARLRLAIQNNALELFYQPQADFRTSRVVGAEALLRWNDAQLGTVAPNVAVSVAESSGLINELTLWVINSAVRQCAAFRAVQPDFTVSINISPSNLHESDLAAYVGRALRTWNVGGRGVVFEITETAILSDQKLAMEALNELKRLGVGISVDDFGTGYSSMYYLAQMPLDELKIDIMFVRQMLQLPQHAKIVRSLIDLAHNLELGVVAEGVEDGPIWSALQHLGCDRAQGWHIGKPMPAADLAARLPSTGPAGQ